MADRASIASAALAAAIVIIGAIVAAFAWYQTGWEAFSYGTGDAVSWQPSGGAGVDMLRFRDVTFTVARSDGVTRTRDVTAVLNGMAVAYDGATDLPGAPATLDLVRPLNAFSFIIPGFNDRATVANPGAVPWCSAPPAASPSPAASPAASPTSTSPPAASPPAATRASVICPGAALATLVGRVRTL